MNMSTASTATGSLLLRAAPVTSAALCGHKTNMHTATRLLLLRAAPVTFAVLGRSKINR
jgi:hypothetical protein